MKILLGLICRVHPYLDGECVKKGLDFASENHLWGERKYYKSDYYRNAPSVFASEMGYHGCPSPESVKRFITADALWPYQNNQEWLLHASSPTPKKDEPFGYRVELMANQIQEMFGLIPDDLEEFALASQISQAEAKKYFIERFRIKKWKRSGIIWWNICDGWPQFSDAVVDYYYVKKLAYHYIQRSQQPLCLMMDEPEDGICRLVGVNDTLIPHEVDYRVTGFTHRKILAQGKAVIGTATAQVLEPIPLWTEKELLLIEWQGEQITGKNSYLMGNPVFDLAGYVKWRKTVAFCYWRDLPGISSRNPAERMLTLNIYQIAEIAKVSPATVSKGNQRPAGRGKRSAAESAGYY